MQFGLLTLHHFFLLRTFLQWHVVAGMEAEKVLESLANYTWLLRVPNTVCISQLLLIDRRALVDLGRHKCAFLVAFNLEKLIIVVNSIKRRRAGTCLGLTYETTICSNLTAKVSVKCIKWFSICASLKLTNLISLITIKGVALVSKETVVLRRWEYYKIIWFYQLSWQCKIATVKRFESWRFER